MKTSLTFILLIFTSKADTTESEYKEILSKEPLFLAKFHDLTIPQNKIAGEIGPLLPDLLSYAWNENSARTTFLANKLRKTLGGLLEVTIDVKSCPLGSSDAELSDAIEDEAYYFDEAITKDKFDFDFGSTFKQRMIECYALAGQANSELLTEGLAKLKNAVVLKINSRKLNGKAAIGRLQQILATKLESLKAEIEKKFEQWKVFFQYRVPSNARKLLEDLMVVFLYMGEYGKFVFTEATKDLGVSRFDDVLVVYASLSKEAGLSPKNTFLNVKRLLEMQKESLSVGKEGYKENQYYVFIKECLSSVNDKLKKIFLV